MRFASLFVVSTAALSLVACNPAAPAADVASENESKMSDRIVSLEQTISDAEAAGRCAAR